MFFCGLKSVIFWLDRRHENIDPAGMGFCFIALFFFSECCQGTYYLWSFSFFNYCKKTTLIEKEHGRVGRCRVWSEVHCAELLLGCFGCLGGSPPFCFFFLLCLFINSNEIKKIAICCGRKTV
jgi:hypothetical protein